MTLPTPLRYALRDAHHTVDDLTEFISTGLEMIARAQSAREILLTELASSGGDRDRPVAS